MEGIHIVGVEDTPEARAAVGHDDSAEARLLACSPAHMHERHGQGGKKRRRGGEPYRMPTRSASMVVMLTPMMANG